jgi:hypothetical protein
MRFIIMLTTQIAWKRRALGIMEEKAEPILLFIDEAQTVLTHNKQVVDILTQIAKFGVFARFCVTQLDMIDPQTRKILVDQCRVILSGAPAKSDLPTLSEHMKVPESFVDLDVMEADKHLDYSAYIRGVTKKGFRLTLPYKGHLPNAPRSDAATLKENVAAWRRIVQAKPPTAPHSQPTPEASPEPTPRKPW